MQLTLDLQPPRPVRAYIKGAIFDPGLSLKGYVFHPSAENYADWRRHYLSEAAMRRWDIKIGVWAGEQPTMLRDVQRALWNLRAAREEARRAGK